MVRVTVWFCKYLPIFQINDEATGFPEMLVRIQQPAMSYFRRQYHCYRREMHAIGCLCELQSG
jgi:hypothetical protein